MHGFIWYLCFTVVDCLDVVCFFISAILIRQTKCYARKQQMMLLMLVSNCENHYPETSKSQSVSMERWEDIGLESTSFWSLWKSQSKTNKKCNVWVCCNIIHKIYYKLCIHVKSTNHVHSDLSKISHQKHLLFFTSILFLVLP